MKPIDRTLSKVRITIIECIGIMTMRYMLLCSPVLDATRMRSKRAPPDRDKNVHGDQSHLTKDTSASVGDLVTLRFREFFAAVRADNIALWSLFLYVLIEYLRPQNMYPVIDVIPWGQFALMICLVSIFATGSKAIAFGAMERVFALFTFLVILSVFFAMDVSVSLKNWSTYTSWVLLYICVLKTINTPRRMLLFTIFFLLINFKMSQHGTRTFAMRGFDFTHWGLSGSGFFQNSGELALQMVVIFAIGICLLLGFREYVSNKKRWWLLLLLFPGTALITVIGSSSRGGQLALLSVLVLIALGGTRRIRKSILIAAVLLLVLSIIPDEQMARFDTAGSDTTSELRLTHWRHAIDTVREHPMGIGYRNWGTYYASSSSIDTVEEIHNTSLEAFVELGVLGGLTFHLALVMALVMNRRTRREMTNLGGVDGDAMSAIARGLNLGLVGTFVAASFMSVLYYPMYWLAFALTSALRHISRDLTNRSTVDAIN